MQTVRPALTFLALLLTGVAVYEMFTYKEPLHKSPLALSTAKLVAPNDEVVYLVTGRGEPRSFWLTLSKQPGVRILFATWKDNLGSKYNNTSFLTYFYPKSTWTSTRNFLYSNIPDLEHQLQRRFNFILFADEDIVLRTRDENARSFFARKDTDTRQLVATILLQNMLQRDQPARASVEYAAHPKAPIEKFSRDCVQSCAFDGALDIYHRSIIDSFLPYSERYDAIDWHMSQYIMNMHSLVLDSCNLYREVYLDPGLGSNQHGRYPHDGRIYPNVTENVFKCLLRHGLQLVHRRKQLNQSEARRQATMRPLPGEKVTKCTSSPRAVNYSSVLAAELTRWPLSCGR
eukprot:scpid87244/ scgid18070/ 